MDLEDFQKKAGYVFGDERLLEQALTHSSYANERHGKRHTDNERLEFLGDAVLELVSSEFLYSEYPEFAEGDLTKLRASLVCEPTLAFCTGELELGTYIRLGKGEEHTGGRQRKSILSDALEAVIGAIYLDGGLEAARRFILRFILTDIEHKQLFYDSKTRLQEVVQASSDAELSYRILKEEGPDHDKVFTAEVRVGTRVIGTGCGNTKKAAEQEAAYHGLVALKQEGAGTMI